MLNCRDLESNLTAYVDGECGAADRSQIEAHLSACPRCRALAARERTAHELLHARCADLRGCAPDALRQRCAAQRAFARHARPPLLRRSWVRMSLAASLVLASGVFLLFGWGSSVETYAAQLAADHVKCFQFPPDPAGGDAATMARDWLAANGWPMRLAADSPPDQLELVGVRRCGSTRGRVAHILYKWRGEPLSVYVLNDRLDERTDASQLEHAHHSVRKFGEQELIWSEDGRTYAVVARAPEHELQQVVHFVRQRIE
jgi:anti-sigma factor RsiW